MTLLFAHLFLKVAPQAGSKGKEVNSAARSVAPVAHRLQCNDTAEMGSNMPQRTEGPIPGALQGLYCYEHFTLIY